MVNLNQQDEFTLQPFGIQSPISKLFNQDGPEYLAQFKQELDKRDELIFEFPYQSVEWLNKIIQIVMKHENSLFLMCDYGRNDFLIGNSLRVRPSSNLFVGY